jgi:hypothetical protein
MTRVLVVGIPRSGTTWIAEMPAAGENAASRVGVTSSDASNEARRRRAATAGRDGCVKGISSRLVLSAAEAARPRL